MLLSECKEDEAAPTFNEILDIIKKNPDMLDTEGKEILSNITRLQKAKPTVESTKQLHLFKKLLENWYFNFAGIDEKVFLKPLDAFFYLSEEGYKIDKSNFYARFVRGVTKQKDGSMYKRDVDARIKEFGLCKRDADIKTNEDEIARRTRLAAMLREESSARLVECKINVLNNKYILKTEHEQILTKSTEFFVYVVLSYVDTNAGRLIETVKGDISIDEFRDFLHKDLRRHLSNYVKFGDIPAN